MKKYILYFLLTIFIVSLYFFLSSYNQSVQYFDFGDPSSPNKVCFLAGVHGNEPAASLLLKQLVKTDYFYNIAQKKGIFIRVLPGINEFGLAFGIRVQNSLFNPDINRTFKGDGEGNISKEMIALTKDIPLIIDFHEGWGFHLIDKDSLGSSLTSTKGAMPLAEKILERVNQEISVPEHKFTIIDRMCEIKSAFSCYSDRHGKKYILVETSGQNDVQPIQVRQKQVMIVLDTVLEFA